ncbi:MAG: DUF4214 domain-containing protein [Burkholderiales bacterium]|nr:DUF4214 domain-containing protein [Burkholderiales bacterium]
MAIVSDVTAAHTTGLQHIDALIDDGPNWNYLLPATNTLTYTFTVGIDDEVTNSNVSGPVTAFNSTQQAAVRSILSYITTVTGIQFSEVGGGATANIHFSNANISGANFSGYCSWHYNYHYTTGQVLTNYAAIAYVYLDNVEWAAQNASPSAGTYAYETLLHEMGHALGLKHSFNGAITLPTAEDNTSYSLMSYTHSGGNHTSYSPYDLAALAWLYGGDGLAGTDGLNSATDNRVLYGSSHADTITTATGNDKLYGAGGNDILQGGKGNDLLDGGEGIDVALFAASRSQFSLSKSGSDLIVSDNTGALGNDTLRNVERIQFSDKIIAFDTDGAAGKAYRLYQAAFDRVPDADGLGYWVKAMDKGASLHDVASGFVTSSEFTSMYGSNPTAEAVVSTLYNHVLHRAAESGGYNYWVGVVKGGAALSDVLGAFSESAENQAQLIGVIQNGMEFSVA